MYSQDIEKKNGFHHFNIKNDDAKVSREKRYEAHKEMLSNLSVVVDNTDKRLHQLHQHVKKHLEGNVDNQMATDELTQKDSASTLSRQPALKASAGSVGAQKPIDPKELLKQLLSDDSSLRSILDELNATSRLATAIKEILSRFNLAGGGDCYNYTVAGVVGLGSPTDGTTAWGTIEMMDKIDQWAKVLGISSDTLANMTGNEVMSKLNDILGSLKSATAKFAGIINQLKTVNATLPFDAQTQAQLNQFIGKMQQSLDLINKQQADHDIQANVGIATSDLASDITNYVKSERSALATLPGPDGPHPVPPGPTPGGNPDAPADSHSKIYHYSGNSDNAMEDAANLMSEYADLSQEKLSHKNAELNRILQELSEKVKKTTTLQNIQTQLQAIANKDNTNPSVRDLLYDAKKNPNGVSEATIDKWAAAVGMNPEDLKNEKLQDFEDLISTAQQDENDQKNMKQQLQVEIQTDLGYVQMAIQSASSIVRDLVSLLKALAQALAG